VLEATRPHIELYRTYLEQRGLAASTVDRRLTTVSGSTGSPASTDGSRPTPRSTSVARRCIPPMPGVWTAQSSACFCSPRSDAGTIMQHWPCSLV
jgi:hypothetical protein